MKYFNESNFFSKTSIVNDEIVPFNKIDRNKLIESIEQNKLYEYKVYNKSKTFIFRVPSNKIYSCIFTQNDKTPSDALKVTFGPVKEEYLNLTFKELSSLLETRESLKQISSNPIDVKKIFSIVYTILRKIYYPEFTKIAFRATLLPSELPFKNLFDQIKEKNSETKKNIIDIVNLKSKEIEETLSNDSEVLKRFLKLKNSFISKLNKKNEILSKKEIIQLFNEFEQQAFFRHRMYKTAINLSLSEIEKEINKTIKVEFDYDLTDRYIVINLKGK